MIPERTLFLRDRHFAEIEPVPLRQACAAALDSLRLAWEADRRGLFVVLGLQTAAASAQIAQMIAGRKVVGAVLGGEEPRSQARSVLALGTLTVIARGGHVAASAFQAPVAQAVSRRARGRILDVVAAMELADVEDPAFQDKLQRALMGGESQSRLMGVTLTLPSTVLDLVLGVAALGSTDRVLVPLGLASAVPYWFLNRRNMDHRNAFRTRVREGREVGILRHYLVGTEAAHELRLFDAAPFFRARHDELAEETAREQNAIMARNNRRVALSSLVSKAMDAPVTGRLLLRAGRKKTSLDDAVTGGLAARRMMSGFQRMFQQLSSLPHAASMVSDYRDFDFEREARQCAGPAPKRHFERILVEDLTFTYRGGSRPVLDGVNLEIRQGEVVALVGENGCGKTTLAKVLCCLYRPDKGAIRWDDVDVVRCDPAGVRAHIAVVFQDFVRYRSLTAAQNIGIGLPARIHDGQAIEDAARRAGAHDAIAALPDGYDTILSRTFGGTDLSTGQWQRVALARAFLRDAPLVVLDEPTAALDPRAERDLFATVASLYRSRSALLISHRLSSVRFADRICVLADGRIIESGSHDELLGTGGAYAELFDMQARAYR